MTSAQYLFPNRMIAGFGDTHPNYLSNTGIDNILKYAVRHKLTSLADSFHALKAAVQPDASAQDIARYVSPSFYAPNVSWVVQRTGMDVRHDLMISLNGSLGNHQHANGISMELYGKGYVLGSRCGHRQISLQRIRLFGILFPVPCPQHGVRGRHLQLSRDDVAPSVQDGLALSRQQ
jgi:hypothetical protein